MFLNSGVTKNYVLLKSPNKLTGKKKWKNKTQNSTRYRLWHLTGIYECGLRKNKTVVRSITDTKQIQTDWIANIVPKKRKCMKLLKSHTWKMSLVASTTVCVCTIIIFSFFFFSFLFHYKRIVLFFHFHTFHFYSFES